MPKILLVDDYVELLDFFSALLRDRGFDVRTASSRKELNAGMLLFIPDLIILDIMLQDGDGRDICKEIKEKHNKDVAIILTSASNGLLKDYQELNADAVIEKPFDIHAVCNTVNQVLKARQNICID